MKTQKPHVVPKYVIYGFFSLGLLSAIAFRAIIVFQHLEPNWVRPVWYLGIIGYLLFFFYRFKITKKRKKAITDFELLEKVKNNTPLTDEDREVLLYLLSSIKVSLEDMNYALIFLLSIVAIAADIILSTMK
ncbi:MAG: hypothetical protein ACE5J5_02740 [Candidatus Hydrothermarchaeales archaeon]